MSVHRLESGRHEVRWREGAKQRSRRFDRKGDADAWDREVKRRAQLGPLAVQQLTVKGPTLTDWIAKRWVPEHASRLEEHTRDRYASSYELHVEPWLGHLPLQELTVGRLREWQARRLAAGVSAHGVVKARTVLSSVLRHAAESEAIAGNPLALVRSPKAPHAEQVTALSPTVVERLRTLLAARDRAIVSVLAYAGLRPSELRALRWGDIGTNTILVQRAASPSGKIKATKTRLGVRNVRLLPALADDLAEWRALTGGHGRELVFPSTGGQPMTKDAWGSWRARAWTPAQALVVDHGPTPYDLRHSFASLLLAEGRSVHYVAGQLGHDPVLTLSRYGHLIAEYADSLNIDVDHEITAARAAAADWQPTRPARPAEPGLGARQRRVLREIAAAGTTGATFDVSNDRRAAVTLVGRGLADRRRRDGEASVFVATPRGRRAANQATAP
jgi:integrase